MSNIDNLTQQILSQGTTSSWSGQGLGGPEANAREMARLLDEAGITNINDFGIVYPTKFAGGRPAIYIDSDTWTAPTENPFRPGTYQTFTGTRGQYAVFNPDWGGYDFFRPDAIVNTPEGPKLGPVEMPSGEPPYFGNTRTKQPIQQGYNRANAPGYYPGYYNDELGGTFSGTYSGKGRTDFNVIFKNGKPIFYTQYGGDTSSFGGNLGSVLGIGLALFAPGIGGAIGSALTGTAATTIASQAIGGAIVQGLLSEAQGGDFLDGAIKGAVTAGVAPAVAETVGQSVAGVMGDTAIKNAVANAVSSSAASAVTAALTGGDVDQAALTGALAGGAAAAGRDVATAIGAEGAAGGAVGKVLGAIAAGVDPEQAVLNAVAGYAKETESQKPAEPTTQGTEPPPQEAPVTVPGAENVAELIGQPGVELAGPLAVEVSLPLVKEALPENFPIPEGYRAMSREEFVASPKELREAGIDVRESDPVDGKTALIVPVSTGKISLEGDNIVVSPVFELGTGVLPEQIDVAPAFPEIEIPVGGEVGVSTDTTLPPTEVPPFIPEQPNILDLLASGRGDVSQGQPLTVTTPEVAGPEIGATAPVAPPALEEVPAFLPEIPGFEGVPEVDRGAGGGEFLPSDQTGMIGGAGTELPFPFPQEIPIPDQISQELEVVGVQPEEGEKVLPEEEIGIPGIQEGIAGTIPEEYATEFIARPYISSGRRRPTAPTTSGGFGPTVQNLGQALAAPLFPTTPVSGLTSIRGAGEIEAGATGKRRRNVWNEASLRLKDALGI